MKLIKMEFPKSLHRGNYLFISKAIAEMGSYQYNKIGHLFKDKIEGSAIRQAREFLNWCFANELSFNAETYTSVYKKFLNAELWESRVNMDTDMYIRENFKLSGVARLVYYERFGKKILCYNSKNLLIGLLYLDLYKLGRIAWFCRNEKNLTEMK